MATKRYFKTEVTLAADTPVAIKAPTTVARTLYVTKMVLSIITHAAKFVAVSDTNDSPKAIAKHVDAAAAAGVPSTVTWDFGRRGISCATGKNLSVVSESSGPAGILYCEGYEV